MLENQENNQNQEPELSDEVMEQLTIEQKLEQIVIFPHNLKEVSEVPVKQILDALELEVRGYDYYGPSRDEVTIRQELEKLNKVITERDGSIKNWREKFYELDSKRDRLIDYLDENWNDIDEEVRDELCLIFEIDNEVEKSVTISMTGTITIRAPRGYDWDNIDSDLDVDVSVDLNNSDLDTVGYGFDLSDCDIEAE